MRTSAARPGVSPDLVVVDDETGGVPLADHEMGETGGDETRVVELRRAGSAGETHGAAGVEHHLHPNVGRLAKLFRVDAIGAGEEFPVDVLEVVARTVMAVLTEFGAVAVERAAVEPRKRPLDSDSRHELEIVDRGEENRIEHRAQG